MTDIRDYFTGKGTAFEIPCQNAERKLKRKEAHEITDRMVNELDASEITLTFRAGYDELDDNEIKEYINKYFRFVPLNLRELFLVAEYGETNRLHFHGIVRGTHKDMSQLLKWIKRRFGRATIKTISHPEQYNQYIWKEHPDWFLYNNYTNSIYL